MNPLLKLFHSLAIILLAFNMTACMGAPLPANGIEALHQGATLFGIEKALAGGPETFIMRSIFNPNLFIVSWNVKDVGWAFVLLDANGSAKTWTQLTGNIGTPKTLTELISGATALQFRFVKNLGDVSLALCRGVELAKSWISKTANSMPVILVAPVGAIGIPEGILPPAGEIE